MGGGLEACSEQNGRGLSRVILPALNLLGILFRWRPAWPIAAPQRRIVRLCDPLFCKQPPNLPSTAPVLHLHSASSRFPHLLRRATIHHSTAQFLHATLLSRRPPASLALLFLQKSVVSPLSPQAFSLASSCFTFCPSTTSPFLLRRLSPSQLAQRQLANSNLPANSALSKCSPPLLYNYHHYV